MDEEKNALAGIPNLDFASNQILPNVVKVVPPQVQELATTIQKNSAPNKIDIGTDRYLNKPSNSIWQDNTVKKPSLESWNNNLDSAYTQLNDGTYITKFENYVQGSNNEDRLAKEQGAGEQWLNGGVKFLEKTAINILDGTVGTVNGLINGITEGSMSAVYNNDFSKWIDDLNTKVDYKLPNLYTEQEKNMSLGRSVFTSNFLADKVLGGMAFVTGTLISEALWAYGTGGASLASAGTRVALKGAEKFLAKEVVEEGAEYVAKNRILHSITKMNDAYQRTIPLNTAGKVFNNARYIYTSAGYEAGVEARHYLKEAEANYIQSYSNAKGRRPDGQELAEFRDTATNTANALFIANVGLVASSNIAQFGTILGVGGMLESKGLSRAFNRSLGIGIEKTVEAGKDVYTALKPSRLQKVLGTSYNVLKSPIREGVYEEGLQSVFGNFGQRYLEAKYNPQALEENFDVMSNLGKAMAKTYGTKEGLEEVLIGAIIGFASPVLQGRGFGVTNYANQVNAQEEIAQTRTKLSDFNLLQKIAGTTSQKAFKANAIKNFQNDNAVLANQELNMSLFAKLSVDNTMGLLENSTENFRKTFEGLSETELAEQLNVSVEEAKTAKELAIEAHAIAVDNFKNSMNLAENLIPADGQQYKVDGVVIPNADIQQAMALNIYMGKNSDTLARKYAEAVGDLLGDSAGVTSALKIVSSLQEDEKVKTREVSKLNKELQAIDKAVNSRTNEFAKLASKPRAGTTDSQLEKLENRRQELLAQEEADQNRKTQIEEELSTIVSDINRASRARQVANQDFGTLLREGEVTADSLTQAIDSLEELGQTLDVWKKAGQNGAVEEVEYLLSQFDQSVLSYQYANDAFNQLVDVNSRQKATKDIFGKVISIARKNSKGDLTEYETASRILYGQLAEQWQKRDKLTNIFQEEEQVAEEVVDTIEEVERVEDEFPTPIPQTKREDINRKVDNLPDDLVFITHITSDGNAVNIFNSNLLMPAGVSSTTGIVTKEQLKQLLFDLSEGKSPHRGYLDLFLGAINRTALENTNGKTLQDKLENYLYENFIEDIAKTQLPSTLNIGYFTDGVLNTKFDNSLEVTQEITTLTQETLKEYLQSVANQLLEGRRKVNELNPSDTTEIIPTEQEQAEYKKLYERNRKSKNGLRPKDAQRFEELRQKLDNYGKAIGTANSQGIRLADLLEQIQTLDQAQTEEKSPVINETHTEEINAKVVETNIDKANVASKTQFYDKSEWKKDEVTGNISVTGINVQGIVDLALETNDFIQVYDNNGANSGKLTAKELTSKGYKKGDKFIVKMGDIKIPIEIGNTGNLIFTEKAVELLNQATPIKILPIENMPTNYQTIMREVGTELIPLNTNYELEPGIVFSNPSELPEDTNVRLVVSTKLEYNKERIKAYRKNPKKFNELVKELNIYAMVGNKLVGVMKGINASTETGFGDGAELFNIREVAVRRALEANLENEMVDVNIEIPINKNTSYFGKPIYKIEYNSGNPRAILQDFSDKAVKKIKDAGYYQDGKLNTNRNVEGINTIFLKRLPKVGKFPIVIFDYLGQNIAYPVSMKEIQTNKEQAFEDLLNTPTPTVKKVQDLNQLLSLNGISPNSDLGFYSIGQETNLTNPAHLDKVREALSTKKDYFNVDDWANVKDIKVLREVVKEQARINIDISDNPFHSPKLDLRLKDKVIIGAVERQAVEVVEDVESEVKEEVTTFINEKC